MKDLLFGDEVLHHHVSQVLTEGVTVLVTRTHRLHRHKTHKHTGVSLPFSSMVGLDGSACV